MQWMKNLMGILQNTDENLNYFWQGFKKRIQNFSKQKVNKLWKLLKIQVFTQNCLKFKIWNSSSYYKIIFKCHVFKFHKFRWVSRFVFKIPNYFQGLLVFCHKQFLFSTFFNVQFSAKSIRVKNISFQLIVKNSSDIFKLSIFITNF